MRYLKNLGRVLGYISIIIIILTMLVTIFSYFNIFNDSLTKIMKYIIPIISVFIGGIMMGIRANKKGIVEGARLALIIDIIFVIFSLILSSFKPQSLIYYLIISITTIFGSMIGVQKKVQD